MSKAKLTFQSALWNHAGRILEYVLMYVTSIVIARGLGVQENGRFVGLFSLSQMLLVFSSFGLETSLNKFIPQLAQEKQNEKATFILRRALLIRVCAVFVATISFAVFVQFVAVPILANSGKVLLVVLLFTGVRSIFPLFVTVLTAQLQTALTARINLVIRTIEIIAVLLLLQFHFTVESLFLVFLATSALHVLAYALLSRLNFLGNAEPVEMSPIVTFGGIYWINTIVDFVLGRQGDVLFLTSLLPDSSDGGLYDVAYSVAELATMAMTVGLAGVTFATFARLAVSDRNTMDKFYAFSIRIISLLTIPLYAFMIFGGERVIAVLYSSHYLGAAALVQGILVFRIASRLFGGPENGEYLLSHGRVGLVVALGTVAATTNVVLNIFLIPTYGAFGTVIASGCGNLLVNMLAAVVVYKTSANRMQFWFWLKSTLACLAAAYVSTLLIPPDNVMTLIGSGATYLLLVGIAFTAIKPLKAEDTEWLSRVNQKTGKLLSRFTAVPANIVGRV